MSKAGIRSVAVRSGSKPEVACCARIPPSIACALVRIPSKTCLIVSMNSLRLSELERLAAALVTGARLELHLTPKPGLVDRLDNGSHPDLSFATMERSIAIVEAYLQATVASLAAGENFAAQNALGRQAEQRLLDELGTNTHKGYIFLAGMLLIARWHAPSGAVSDLRASLSSLCRDFFSRPRDGETHGERARRLYHAGGIVREASDGYPALFEHGLPAFRAAREKNGSLLNASFAMMARLMQTVDDTTMLHRAGPGGLARMVADGRWLQVQIADGGNARPFLETANRNYVAANMTMGGVADMLGLGYGVLIAAGELSEDDVAALLSAA